jgi:N-acetylglutamate synthase/N-acetylornithine aminotransferase
MRMKVEKKPIVVPGFRFAGVSCGIKPSKKKDLALIVSDVPATAAAAFTTNQVKGAPVLVGAPTRPARSPPTSTAPAPPPSRRAHRTRPSAPAAS